MPRRYTVNAPAVVSESIDGEAVIMNLRSGHYYSTRDSGALAWQALGEGHAASDVAAALAAAYGVSAADARNSLDGFVADLLAHALLLADDTPAASAPLVMDAGPGARWSPPTLAVYTDMEDLLLLDPIHDVGEAGWPVPLAGDP